MKVLKHENLVYIDVDNTLVMWPSEPFERNGGMPFTSYGRTVFLVPHEKQIHLLKSYHDRGYYVIVHSAAGWEWAEHVVNVLMLTPYVHEVRSKPSKYVDDKPASNWMQKVYIPFDGGVSE